MKGLILFFLICLPFGISAQTYHDFPLDSTSSWVVSRNGYNTQDCWRTQELRYFIDGQFEQNGLEYTKISYSGNEWTVPINSSGQGCAETIHHVEGFVGYMRADSGRYYVWMGSEEELIYDFTLEVGDTLQNTFTSNSPFIVDSIEYLDVNGKSCKQMSLISDGSIPELEIVEGVGSTHGLVEPLFNGFFEFWLYCYSENEIPVYPDNAWNCWLTDIKEEFSSKAYLTPNPTSNNLSIFGLTSPTSFSIHNLLGKEVMSGIVNDKEELYVSGLPKGIYICKMLRNGHSVSLKFVKQ